MTATLLTAAFLILGFSGYRIMDQVDRFLKEHWKGDEEEADEPAQR